MTFRCAAFLLLALLGTPCRAASCDDYAAQLGSMLAADQAIREVASASVELPRRLGNAWEAVDAQNLKRLRSLLARCGWPVASRYGWAASDAAFFLVQHADADRLFQRRALPVLEGAVLAGEARGGHLAYLSDRLAVAEGRPQLYGTQFTVKDCRLELLPIDSREAVEQRRAAIAGMPTLDAYEARARAEFAKAHCER